MSLLTGKKSLADFAWVDPGKSRSLAALTLIASLTLFIVWGLQQLSSQKTAPYPWTLSAFCCVALTLSVMLYLWPQQATRMSLIGIFGAMLFVMSTVYRSLFGHAESPYLKMWFISASHAYVLILQIVIFAIFQRGATLLCGILHTFTCLLIASHLILNFHQIPPVTYTPMVTLTVGPMASLFGLTFLVRWRNEATLKELAMQQEKEKLMAMMSHEIRGQLQTTLSTSELLSTKVHDPLGNRALKRLTRVTLQLDRYLRDWVEFVRLENPELGIEEKRFNLVELIDQSIEEYQSKFIDKGVVLTGPIWSSLPHADLLRWKMAQGDPVRLQQVLHNLIDNALKYTSQGSVSIGVHTPVDRPHWSAISVTDTGSGIEADHLRMVFEPFTRVAASSAVPVEGSGLGLAIASRLMQRMGGRLEAVSQPGKGTSFTMSFPLKLRQHLLR